MLKSKMLVRSLLVLVIAAAAGCNGSHKRGQVAKSSPPMSRGVLDIPATQAPPPAPVAPPVAYTPTAPPQPVIYDAAPATAGEQPVIGEPVADASDSAVVADTAAPAKPRVRKTASGGGTKYKIKKGESLWSIAQARYGNGQKWKAIAAANPKIDPNRIQAGQTIVLP